MNNHPSYCCPKCGEQIGWLGRFFNFFIPNYHRCERKPYKPKIKIEEYLKEMNKFFSVEKPNEN